ncbi:unnamed protein product, partial [Phaeothamnion confervicola]
CFATTGQDINLLNSSGYGTNVMVTDVGEQREQAPVASAPTPRASHDYADASLSGESAPKSTLRERRGEIEMLFSTPRPHNYNLRPRLGRAPWASDVNISGEHHRATPHMLGEKNLPTPSKICDKNLGHDHQLSTELRRDDGTAAGM